MHFVDIAIQLALKSHHGVTNKHDGEPYILHVHRVASNFDTRSFECAVAWLHDSVEDTDLTLRDINKALHSHQIGQEDCNTILDAVDAMTKRRGESNSEYYQRVRRNEIARNVKIADIHDNFGRNYLIEDEATRLRMAKRYSQGIEALCRQGI